MTKLGHLAIFILLLGLLSGCATRQLPPSEPLNPLAVIDTLTSSVALSVTAGDKGLSGRGYLVMRSPDQFRLVILSPFGTTLAEIFLAGDELLYLASTQNLAYRGGLGDLPDAPALQGWRLLRWTTERVSPQVPGQLRLSRVRADGEEETVHFDRQGLVLKKRSNGDEVRYDGYRSIAGVPVPTTIEITDRAGIRVRIVLDEPEVNTPLDENAFIPVLDGVTVLPLRQFPTS